MSSVALDALHLRMPGLARSKAPSGHAVRLIILNLLLAVSLAYWLWVGLFWRSFHFDDGTSILAIQGIMEHGYPVLPSGFIYYRGYVPNYLSAASSLVLGLNSFTIILPSLLMGLGILWLVYAFARDLLKLPWLGIAAAALLVVLQFQTVLFTSPRMYTALEFFALLSSYSAWRGFVKGSGRYQWLTFLGLTGAILSHVQSGALLVAIPLAVLAARWAKKEEKSPINYLMAFSGLAALFAGHFILYQAHLPDALPPIGAHSGLVLDRVGPNLDPVNWLGHLLALETAVPLSATLSPLIALLAFQAFKNRSVEANQGTIYALLVLVISSLITMSVIRTLAPRFWALVLPMYVILICAGLTYLISWVSDQGIHWRRLDRIRFHVVVLPAVLAGSTAVILLVFSLVLGADRYFALVKGGYGVPCSEGTCSKDIKLQYSALKRVMQEGDVIISSNPVITSYYLGYVDGWFREKIVSTGFSSFESATDEYFGIQFVDTEQELNRLREGSQRVWLIIDYKADTFSSKELLNLVERSYVSYLESGPMTIYVNPRAAIK